MRCNRTRPAGVCLALTATVKRFTADLKTAGCTVDHDKIAGTVVATEPGGKVVYRALQKGNGQPWIVSMYNGDMVTWAKNS